MSVTDAVTRELEAVRTRDEALAESGLAANALVMAEILDGSASPNAKTMAGKELRETLQAIRALMPPAVTDDRVTDLSSRRAERLKRRAAS